MINKDFKDYMESNDSFNHLRSYYNSYDIADVYGVKNMEIKHSNFLSWLFNLNKKIDNKVIDYPPIRGLLKIIQNNNFYKFLNNINLDEVDISNVNVLRECHNIDLLITLKINNENYVIVIENKIDSLIHGNQLEKYSIFANTHLKDYKKILLFLYAGYELKKDQIDKINNSKYTIITYQNIYDYVLKDLLIYSNNDNVKYLVKDYIHNIACYNSDYTYGLIVTNEEKEWIELLFKDEYFLKMIDSLSNDKENEYVNYYYNNKYIFIIIFNKYKMIYKNNNMVNILNNVLSKKMFILDYNGEKKGYKNIGKLLKVLFDILLKEYNLKELNELIYIFPESFPLLIHENKIDNLDKKSYKLWYTKYPQKLDGKYNDYYVLRAWNLREYEEFKKRFSYLQKFYSDIYGKINIM